MWKRLQKEIHLIHILYSGSRQRRNPQFEGLEEYVIIKSILEQDGGLILRSHRETCGIRHLRLHQINGNCVTIGSRTKVGILGDPHPGLNSSDFLVQRCSFACQKVWIPWQSTEVCRQIHLPHATFSHAQSLHSTDDMSSLAQGAWGLSRRIVCQNTFAHPRVMFPLAPHSTLNTSTSSLSPSLSCATVVLFSKPRPVVHAAIYPLWRSTAGWYLYWIPLLYSLWAQEDRAQEDSGQSHKNK